MLDEKNLVYSPPLMLNFVLQDNLEKILISKHLMLIL
jgi:hypothetical protein